MVTKRSGRVLFQGLGLLAMLSVLTGCPPAHEEEELTGSIELASAVLYTLEDTTFEVHIETSDGQHMTTMAELHLEYRAVGGDTWREIELVAGDEHYTGIRVFSNSGDYELRLTGMQHGGHEMEEMATMTITVNRAHAEVGEYYIQYESDPGHIHAGFTATLTFWVALEATGEAVTGLTAQIIVEESDGHATTLDATEGDAGAYSADMHFADDGDAHIEFQFTDDTGPVAVDIHIRIAAVH